MPGRAILLDANLLVLLSTGLASRAYIAAHKRLRAYTARDYDLLQQMLASAPKIIVTPNAATEASNLARQIAEPARTRIAEVLRRILEGVSEIYIASRKAVQTPVFIRLGIADAAMLDHEFADYVLLTADLDLYLEAGRLKRAAVNFFHLIEANR
jgi:hypothetical protein